MLANHHAKIKQVPPHHAVLCSLPRMILILYPCSLLSFDPLSHIASSRRAVAGIWMCRETWSYLTNSLQDKRKKKSHSSLSFHHLNQTRTTTLNFGVLRNFWCQISRSSELDVDIERNVEGSGSLPVNGEFPGCKPGHYEADRILGGRYKLTYCFEVGKEPLFLSHVSKRTFLILQVDLTMPSLYFTSCIFQSAPFRAVILRRPALLNYE